jgi:Fur family ferric uptake transcriptional regulator
MVSTHLAVQRQAENLLGSTGARRTGPRKRVLAFLLEQDRALTRNEIGRRMDGEPLGGITLYRVLIWLTENGLIHRIVCADQSSRFRANGQASRQEHAHFQCTCCGGVTCLHEVLLPAHIAVPPGFTRREADFLIRGTCAGCGGEQDPA